MKIIITERQYKRILREELTSKTNYDKVKDHFKKMVQGSTEQSEDIENLFNNIKDYIEEQGFIIKVLNSCSVPFKGVRTREYIIICSPTSYVSLGDFIYVLFHEIRHELQMGTMGLDNPLTGDIEDFEEFYQAYWDMEIDAHNYGLEWVNKLKGITSLPEKLFRLSPLITRYPSLGHQVRNQMMGIKKMIEDFKKRGFDYNDISDLPIIQQHIDKLEDFL